MSFVIKEWLAYCQGITRTAKLNYRKTSSINRTKSRSLNVSCILLQLSSLSPLTPGVKLRMKMLLEQRRQAMLKLHLSYQQFLLPTKVRLILEVLRYFKFIITSNTFWNLFTWFALCCIMHMVAILSRPQCANVFSDCKLTDIPR